MLAFAVVAAYSVFDELTQLLVGRTADVFDALADWLGAVLGLAAIWFAAAVFPWNRPPSQVVGETPFVDRRGA
jgi:VanZ family protein